MYFQYLHDFRDIIHRITADAHDPHLFHAMLVHFPIVISVLGLVMVGLLVGMRNHSGWVRWLTVALYLAGVGAAWMTAEVGEDALHASNTVLGTAAARDEAQVHARMGSLVGIFMAAATACVVLTVVRVRVLRFVFPALAVIAAIAALGWVTLTAFHGGHLVYVHGIGVPQTPSNLVAPPPTTAPRPTPSP